MITEINPNYDDVLVIDTDDNAKRYYVLIANRKDVNVDNDMVLEDDCMIAYSNSSMDEIVNHRNKLIKSGYYKPTEVYIRELPNYRYRKPKQFIGKPNVF